MTKTIVVPLDGSETAERAVAVATSLGRRLGADVRLMMTSFEPGAESETAYLAAEAAKAGPDVDTEVVPFVFPPRGIVETLDAHPDAVLCMTTHGRGKVAQVLLGSVADEVLREATSPVVLIGPSCRPNADGDEIVLCVDDSHGARALLPIVGDWAEQLDLAVSLVTVDPFLTNGRPTDPVAEDRLASAAAVLAERGLRTESHVLESTHAGDVLVAFADARRAAFIAVGTRDQSSALGRVAGQVVRHSHCPVIVHR